MVRDGRTDGSVRDTADSDYPATAPLADEQLEKELERGRVYRLNDRFFKFLFGQEDRKTLLLDLINAIVFPDGQTGFTGFEHAKRDLSATRSDGKEVRLDIVAHMADGTQVEIEVQVKNRKDYPQRSVYYLSALHTSQMDIGASYRKLKRTISIHILAFSLFEGKRFRGVFALCDTETGERLCDDLTLVYLEAPKFVLHRIPRSRLEYWLLYLTGMEAEDMPEVMVNDPMIGEALDLEKLFLQNREERLKYLLSYKAMRDEQTLEAEIRFTAEAEGREKGRAEGRAEGEAKGEASGIASVARRMIARGLPSEEIAENTGLSLDEVEALREQAEPRP